MGAIPYTAASGWGLIFWPWAAAVHAVPSGWTRDDNYAGRYFQGSTTAGTNGGGGTHTHTQTHTHTGNTHTHSSCSLSSANPLAPQTYSLDLLGIRSGSSTTHTHAGVTSTAVASTWQNDTTGLAAASGADPAYAEVIPIRPTDATQEVPQYGVVLFGSDKLPVGSDWALCDGTLGTVNLDGRFLKAAAAASDPGAAGGGAGHNHTMANHNHSANAHTHPDFQCGDSSTTKRILAGVSSYGARRTHKLTLGPHTEPDCAMSSTTISTSTTEPAHTIVAALEQQNAAGRLHPGIIIGWTGTTATLAADFPDWVVCDGTGGTLNLTANQVKVETTDLTTLGTTGGSNTHSHTISAHAHSAGGTHNHSGAWVTKHDYLDAGASGAATNALNAVKHSVSDGHQISTGSTGTSLQSNSATSSSTDGRVAYRTVIFIQYAGPVTCLIPGGLIPGGLIP